MLQKQAGPNAMIIHRKKCWHGNSFFPRRTAELYQALLHGYFIIASKDPRLLLPHLIAFLQDVAILGRLLVLLLIASVYFPGKCSHIVAVVFCLVAMIYGLILAGYPVVLRKFIAFPMNVFANSAIGIENFLVNYLGINNLWPVIVAALIGIASLAIPGELILTKWFYYILHHATKQGFPEAREEILFVGDSDQWIYGKSNNAREYAFIENARGTVLTNLLKYSPLQLHAEFQSYIDRFAREYGR